MIRELKEEIERLRLGGANDSAVAVGSGGGINDEELRQKMEEQEQMMKEMEADRLDYESKLAE